MKRLLLSSWFLLILLKAFSQDYMITFEVDGEDGPPDSVHIYNQDQNTASVLSGDDILHLVSYGVGISDKQISQNSVDVFPNPFKSSTRVEMYNPHDGAVHIVISDISGRIIVAQESYMRQGYISLNILGLSKGTYLLKIQGMDLEVLKTLGPMIENRKIGRITSEIAKNEYGNVYKDLPDNSENGFNDFLGKNYECVAKGWGILKEGSFKEVPEEWWELDCMWKLKPLNPPSSQSREE